MRRALILALSLLVTAPAARAHPHEFVDAILDFRLDANGYLTGFGVEWRYDDFTTMLILSDLGLNPAATDLTADAAPELQGFDLHWVEGYDGDLWPMADGAPIPMGPPQPGETTLEGGQIVSRHLRPLAVPVDPRAVQVVVQVYDPEFFVAYTIAQYSTDLPGTGCRVRVFGADLEAASATLQAALDELFAAGVDVESDFPRVGRDFADEIRLDCSGGDQTPAGG